MHLVAAVYFICASSCSAKYVIIFKFAVYKVHIVI